MNLPCCLFSLLSFLLFLTKIMGGGGTGPLDPSPRSASVKRGTKSAPVSSFLVISAVVDMYLSKRSILELENLSYFPFRSFCLSYSLI